MIPKKVTSKLTANQIGAAGFCTSAIIFALCASRLLSPIYRLCPLPLIRGIQLGTGLSFVSKGVTSVLASGNFLGSRAPGLAALKYWSDNYIIALIAFSMVIVFYPRKRLNFTAIVLMCYCLVIGLIAVYGYGADGGGVNGIGPAFPQSLMWSNITANDFSVGFLNAGLGQLPLTLLNSVFATSKLADDLFPDRPQPVASISAVGMFVGLMNLIGVW
ncbi:hypothetical protein HDU83_002392 [Entophlyctis luteolus]|nr:hypothetical protein HDU83_002392 [Entophlyctis luteolus]